jgi:hypothetical protein
MDEVFMCMKHGPVYRLFPGKDPIRVTGSNLPSLHRAKFEEEPVVDKVEEVPVKNEMEPSTANINEGKFKTVGTDFKSFDPRVLRGE